MAKSKFYKNRKFIICAAVLAALVIGAVVYAQTRTDNSTNVNPPASPVSTTNQTQTSEQQKAENDARKDAIVQQQQALQNAAPSSPGTKKQVSVIISNASSSRISAYVSGVFEDGGTCTATFTQGSQKFTRTSAGFENATTTNCTPINLSSSDFPSKGTWNLSVSYSSANAQGTSETKTVEVP
jgi:hypothetical protein